jgi:hypothetical protein
MSFKWPPHSNFVIFLVSLMRAAYPFHLFLIDSKNTYYEAFDRAVFGACCYFHERVYFCR